MSLPLATESTEEIKEVAPGVYIRKQKTLIVGPKRGLTAFLARCAAIAILFIRASTPLSLYLCGFYLCRAIVTRRAIWLTRKLWKRIFASVIFVESIFYFYMKHKQASLQRKRLDIVPNMSLADRKILFNRCIRSCASPKHFVESWFEPVVPYHELKRDNLVDLLAWSMFHKSDFQEIAGEEKVQLDSFAQEVESRLGPLQKGMNTSTQILKFTEEPVEGKHRPLFMYGVVHFLFQVVMAPMQMRMAGYKNYTEGSLTFWYRPGKNPNLPPICFIHGIGIGILSYQKWLRLVEKLCDSETGGLAGRGILIPEIHVISQRLNPSELHCDRFVPDMKRGLFRASGHTKACFVGHSYGSFLVAWIVRRAPEMVGACGLVDPACILLHNTEVLHNIVYHRPLPNAVEAVLDYIMRSEVSLVHNLRREFYWFQNILFLEDINTTECPTFVCLGDTDQLVPIYEIKQYVENYNAGKYIDVEGAPHKPAGQIELLWFERCDHAGYLFNSGFERGVAEAIGRVCEKSSRMGPI